MSGLENYQVAIVRGKRRRQLGDGGLGEAARGRWGHQGRGEMPGADELWRTGAPACSWSQKPLLAQLTKGHRSEGQHMHFTVTRAHAHTHIAEKHGLGQRHSSWMLSVTYPANAHRAPSTCQAVCGHLHQFQIPTPLRELGNTRRASLGLSHLSGGMLLALHKPGPGMLSGWQFLAQSHSIKNCPPLGIPRRSSG